MTYPSSICRPTLIRSLIECLREPWEGEEFVALHQGSFRVPSEESREDTEASTLRPGASAESSYRERPVPAEVALPKNGAATGNEAGLNRVTDAGPEEQSAQSA